MLAIATGTRKNDDIVTKSHAPSPAIINPVLLKLLKLGIIKKVTPINDPNNKKKTMYFLNNNSLKFYYKYLYRYANERINVDVVDFYEQYVKNDFEHSYIPNIFESVAKQYLIVKNKKEKYILLFLI